MTRPYKFLAALQVADVALTGVVLHMGGAEANPLARLLTATGVLGLLVLLAVKLSLVILLSRRGASVNLAGAVYGAVVFNNLLALALYAAGTGFPMNPYLLVAGTAVVIFAGIKLAGRRARAALNARKLVTA